MLRVSFLLVVSLFREASGLPTFQALIPNGDKIPNPCNTAELWPGVGHQLIGGSGVRNQFGIDFYNNNKTWTKALCEMDSDGDGLKNGEELGDPNCTWTQNSIPKFVTQLSHPGVCEPLHLAKCMDKNAWLTCPKEFSCPAFAKNTTKSMNLFLPKTAVPVQETTYICKAFQMPNNTKYHEIGLVPYLDNREIMHHMLVYGCSQPPKAQFLNSAVQCSMGLEGCTTIIGLWSVGQDGECHPDQYGFPIGVSGYQYVIVELHWNNPQLKTGLMDGSGVTIYYTDQLRPNDAMIVMTGQQFLEIPPKQESVKYEGTCTAACTKYIQPPKVNISTAFLHMHLLGKSGSIKLLRNGTVSKVLAQQDTYDYNTPVTFKFEEPVEFRSGDEIKVACEFQSLGRNKTVYWGEGTQDEMCFGFITVYPAVPNFDVCVEYQDLKMCSLPQFDFNRENNCMLQDFNMLFEPVGKYCTSNCSTVCKALVRGMHDTGCMEGSMWNLIKLKLNDSPEYRALLSIVESCWQASVSVAPSTFAPTTTPSKMAPNSTNSTFAPTTTTPSKMAPNSTIPPGGNCQPQTGGAPSLETKIAFVMLMTSLFSIWVTK